MAEILPIRRKTLSNQSTNQIIILIANTFMDERVLFFPPNFFYWSDKATINVLKRIKGQGMVLIIRYVYPPFFRIREVCLVKSYSKKTNWYWYRWFKGEIDKLDARMVIYTTVWVKLIRIFCVLLALNRERTIYIQVLKIIQIVPVYSFQIETYIFKVSMQYTYIFKVCGA